jgi:hypothetical protein
MAKPTPQRAGYSSNREQNIALMKEVGARKGVLVTETAQRKGAGVKAHVLTDKNHNTYPSVFLAKGNTHFNHPAQSAVASRRRGHFSTGKADHVVQHEIGHIKTGVRPGSFRSVDQGLKRRGASQPPTAVVARRVSAYATKDRNEFTAEVYAGRRGGQRYDYQVMRAFNEAAGRKPRSVRAQLKRKP